MSETVPDRMVPRDLPRRKGEHYPFSRLSTEAWGYACANVRDVYDAAVAYAAEAGPMPLVRTEEWVEGDAEYRARLNSAGYFPAEWAKADLLSTFGLVRGLPRHRLVRRD